MNNAIIKRKEVCLYCRLGYVYFIYNPHGKFWNIWMLDKEYRCLYHGTCLRSDLWCCITALITVEGR